MAFSRPTNQIINYPPSKLNSFELRTYEWIDNLDFTLDPRDYLENGNEYIEVARQLFLGIGWDGDGRIELMWIPPFMFEGVRTEEFTTGVIIWHVKQTEDGISFILSPVELPDY